MVWISRTVEGGRSFRNTPPSISDWTMPRLTSSARLGCGLNMRMTDLKGIGFRKPEQEPFRPSPKRKGTDFRRRKLYLGCRYCGLSASPCTPGSPFPTRSLKPDKIVERRG